MKGMETCGHHLLIHRHGVIIRLHDWWYSNFDSRQMELSCAQKGVRSLRRGLLELSDTCWQEKLQDHNHYRIPMHAEQQRQCHTWTQEKIFRRDHQSRQSLHPRQKFIKDFIAFINYKRSVNHDIMLNLNANEILGKEFLGISKLM